MRIIILTAKETKLLLILKSIKIYKRELLIFLFLKGLFSKFSFDAFEFEKKSCLIVGLQHVNFKICPYSFCQICIFLISLLCVDEKSHFIFSYSTNSVVKFYGGFIKNWCLPLYIYTIIMFGNFF